MPDLRDRLRIPTALIPRVYGHPSKRPCGPPQDESSISKRSLSPECLGIVYGGQKVSAGVAAGEIGRRAADRHVEPLLQRIEMELADATIDGITDEGTAADDGKARRRRLGAISAVEGGHGF